MRLSEYFDRTTLMEAGIIGLLTAGIGYFIYNRYKVNDEEDIVESQIRHSLEKVKRDLSDNMDSVWASMKNAVLSPKVQDALSAISEIIENVKEVDKIDFRTPLFLLVALFYKVADFREEPCLPDFSDLKSDEFMEAKKIGRFAVRIYSASLLSSKSKIAKALDVEEENIRYISWIDTAAEDSHHPKFVIFQEDDSLFLVIRGTFSVTDVTLDLVCSDRKVDSLNGYAHLGIYEGAEKILAKSLPFINESLESIKRVVLCGHSLGGGSSELIAMELIQRFEKEGREDIQVTCIALAPPPVFRSEVSLPSRVKDAIKIFINTCDIVPSLSLATVALFISILRELDNLDLSLESIFYIMMGSKSDETQETIIRIREAIKNANQDSFPYLEHPGHIYYFSKAMDGTNRTFIKNQVSEYFSRKIRLFDGMVANHLHGNYETAFDNVIHIEA
eukprot:TRINITY_DN6951_c0_g1_i1.p1 TRINITY_DN6951_c0_g1~~TRINITY_DN6951_c0_g1_i1.p1  ORF type:complete len:447 (+),score=130.29 TRINITY_DN6951_c0_g1_i1:70-1410(+)